MRPFTNFQRPGGFLKLLIMFESTPAEQQRELFMSVAQEDPGWAHLLKLKSLTPEKILSWPEIWLDLIWQESPVALPLAIWKNSNTATREKIERSLPANHKSIFLKLKDSTDKIPESELNAASIRLVSHVRDLILSEKINIHEIDPTLALNEKINDFSWAKLKTA